MTRRAKMYKFTIIFGTEMDKEGSAVPVEAIQELDFIYKSIANEFGGYSLHYGHGGYIDSSGALVQEVSATISIFSEQFRYGDALSIVDKIKTILNQESVILTYEVIEDVKFI